MPVCSEDINERKVQFHDRLPSSSCTRYGFPSSQTCSIAGQTPFRHSVKSNAESQSPTRAFLICKAKLGERFAEARFPWLRLPLSGTHPNDLAGSPLRAIANVAPHSVSHSKAKTVGVLDHARHKLLRDLPRACTHTRTQFDANALKLGKVLATQNWLQTPQILGT